MTETRILGLLGWDDLPFYSAIATIRASVVVFGALDVTVLIWRRGWWGPLWSSWLTTPDHKRFGIMCVVLTLVTLLRGFVDAIMIRA